MKNFHKSLLLFFAFSLCLAGSINAQDHQNESDQTKVIIITKDIDNNGNETVQKIIKEGSEAEEFLNKNGVHLSGDNVDIQVFKSKGDTPSISIGEGENIDISIDQEPGQKRIRIKGIQENGESIDIDWEGEGEIPAEIQEKINQLDCQEGARKHNRRMMFREHHGGDRAFLGVVLHEKSEIINGESKKTEDKPGVSISDVVAGSAAEAAGLQANDIITSINGQVVNTSDELTNEIRKNKPGDEIKVSVLRGENVLDLGATLKAREHRSRGHRSFHWDSDRDEDENEYRLLGDRFDAPVQPCKPFIGVYLNLTDHQETGLSVRRVIPNTPADEVNLKIGDVITAIDQVAVNSHGALIVERDKHEAGDQFTLTYLRDGVSQTVTANFPACDQKAINSNTEVIIIEAEEKNNTQPFIVAESSLSLENFRAFPNPTEGLVTLRFAAASKPTVITVTDITGREIFREDLNTFDGIYNQQIDLSSASAGTLLLNIRQEDQVFTDKIILKKND